MRSRAFAAVAAGLVVILVGALAWWRPFLTRPRDFPAAIPQTVPLFTTPLVALPPGQSACFTPAVMDRRSTQARFRVTTFGGPGVPLELTIAGPGYRFATPTGAKYTDNQLLTIPVRAPAHDIATRICIGNTGRRRVALYGVDDVTRAPLVVTRNGRRLGPAVQFAFYERQPVSLGHRMLTVVARMGAFRPGFMGPWLFWPILFLVVLGIPAGALWSLWSAVLNDP